MPKITNNYTKARDAIREASLGLLARAAASHVSVSKQLAPVETGFLRDNIHSNPPTPKSVEVVSDADYSAPVEFGTENTLPQPFFIPGYELAQRQLREEAAQVVAAQFVAAGLR